MVPIPYPQLQIPSVLLLFCSVPACFGAVFGKFGLTSNSCQVLHRVPAPVTAFVCACRVPAHWGRSVVSCSRVRTPASFSSHSQGRGPHGGF